MADQSDDGTAVERMLQAIAGGVRIIDLAHPLSEQTPFSPNSPGYRRSLLRRHGDARLEPDVSFATDILAMGTHVGTHIDAISHISHAGKIHGGHDADEAQRGGAFAVHDVCAVSPIVARGVLLDVARLHGVDVLPAGYGITGDELQAAADSAGARVLPGDVVLVRSGWAAHFGDPETFVGLRDGAPGVTESAADWLIDHRVKATGGETIAYEQIAPGAGHSRMPVHRRLLFDEAIPIIEVLDLRALATVAARSFVFVLTPLPLVGATGSPARPIAIVD